jgi:hypothetical protein
LMSISDFGIDSSWKSFCSIMDLERSTLMKTIFYFIIRHELEDEENIWFVHFQHFQHSQQLQFKSEIWMLNFGIWEELFIELLSIGFIMIYLWLKSQRLIDIKLKLFELKLTFPIWFDLIQTEWVWSDLICFGTSGL